MPEPVVIPQDVIARMPQALRAELGIKSGRSAEVVAVTVPAGDVADVVRRCVCSRHDPRAGPRSVNPGRRRCSL